MPIKNYKGPWPRVKLWQSEQRSSWKWKEGIIIIFVSHLRRTDGFFLLDPDMYVGFLDARKVNNVRNMIKRISRKRKYWSLSLYASYTPSITAVFKRMLFLCIVFEIYAGSAGNISLMIWYELRQPILVDHSSLASISVRFFEVMN